MEPLSRRTLGVAVAALALAACGGDGGSDDLPAVVLPVLPEFPQPAAELDTGEVEGPAVLNFWATWCGPCRTELPEFQRASQEQPAVRFVGVDEGFEPGESVAFLDELGVTYEQFVDTDGEFASELEITELPSTVIIDADGSVVLHHTGALSYADLIAAITDLP